MKKLAVVLFMSFVLVFVGSIPASANANVASLHQHSQQSHGNHHRHHNKHQQQHHQAKAKNIQVKLHPVGDSGITGKVNLNGQKQGDETHIVVIAFGLKPGDTYVSLYYDNHTCELEPYSEDDVIGGVYMANGGGVGTTQGNADDPLDEINSVSVRHAGDFTLLACADVHPGH
jgi:hypothetical protein